MPAGEQGLDQHRHPCAPADGADRACAPPRRALRPLQGRARSLGRHPVARGTVQRAPARVQMGLEALAEEPPERREALEEMDAIYGWWERRIPWLKQEYLADRAWATRGTRVRRERPRRDRGAGDGQALRRNSALDDVDLDRPRGRGAGAARPERRRQDDARARAHDAAEARRRQRAGARTRRGARRAALRARIGLAGQYAAVDENLTGLENLVMVGRLYGDDREARRRAARAARAVRSRRGRPPAREDLLGRDAPAARPGRRAGRHAAGAVPRRADHRARSARPPGPVGRDREARRGRDHGAADHAIPRRGRSAGRPDRRDRPRPPDRRGHLRRAQGPGRRRAPRGAARGRGRRRARNPRARADVRRARRRRRNDREAARRERSGTSSRL